MRRLRLLGQQGAPAVRAGVPLAGPGALVPLSLPKRDLSRAPAEWIPVCRLLGYYVSLALHWLLLGQIPSWIRK